MNLVKRLVKLALGTRLPRTVGTLRGVGSRAPIIIRRDRYGIAYIDAESAWDAWFGLGFVHAQDRAGQLELSLRIVRGTVAEVAGKDALPMDRLVRRLGIPAAGEAQLGVADRDIQEQFAAYTAGINAALAMHEPAHEHALLRIRPSRWEPADAQRLVALLCFALASNWDIELARWQIASADGIGALLALDPLLAPRMVTSSPPMGTLGTPKLARVAERFAADVRQLADVLGLVGGSNAWAIASSRTRTGRPILAGDPHLPTQSPCPFHLVRLKCPEFAAAGAAFVGVPAIASGHNGHVAWGITAAHLDTTDLFIERLGPDGRSVQRGEGGLAGSPATALTGQAGPSRTTLAPCTIRRERIPVRGLPDVIDDVVVTPHGPIVGPAMDGAPEGLALAGTWLATRPYRGLLGAHLCRTLEDLRAAFTQATTTNIGLVMAEAAKTPGDPGRIGWLLAADIPLRKRGTGPLPQPGWDPRFGWDGIFPAQNLPHHIDPPEGFIVAANNCPIEDLHDDPELPFLGVDFLDGYRAKAISRALAARAEWDLADTAKLQLDDHSLVWEDIGAVVLAVPTRPKTAAAKAQALLGAWDGRVAADSPAASVYIHFLTELARKTVRAKAPKAAASALGRGATSFMPHNLLFARRTSHLAELIRERPDGWFPDRKDRPIRPDETSNGWDAAIDHALGHAWRTLRRRHGPRPAHWAWGKVRPLRLKHPFGDKPPLGQLFNLGPYAIGGDATTIPQASVDFRDPEANPIGIASLRMVIDVGDWERSRFVLAGGQSGNPFSRHAADQIPRWQLNDGLPIHWDDAARDRATVGTLRLEPA